MSSSSIAAVKAASAKAQRFLSDGRGKVTGKEVEAIFKPALQDGTLDENEVIALNGAIRSANKDSGHSLREWNPKGSLTQEGFNTYLRLKKQTATHDIFNNDDDKTLARFRKAAAPSSSSGTAIDAKEIKRIFNETARGGIDPGEFNAIAWATDHFWAERTDYTFSADGRAELDRQIKKRDMFFGIGGL